MEYWNLDYQGITERTSYQNQIMNRIQIIDIHLFITFAIQYNFW